MVNILVSSNCARFCITHMQLWNLQFKAMLDELNSEYGGPVYFLNVCWLSCTATLKRFWYLKSKIQNFMKEKGLDVTSFGNKRFLTELAF